jgi:tRNA (cmo5U34)-methyltransferase
LSLDESSKLEREVGHSVRRHLRVEIDEYDASIRRFIPDYEGMIGSAADEVVAAAPDHVLDLGAGTGALAAAVLERAPAAVVELLDLDAEMLEGARVRLRPFGDRARFVVASFDGPFAPCDAIMASLSLHHIPTLSAKAELFGRALRALRPGGVFVNADVTVPADSPGREAAFRDWADHLVASGIPENVAWQHFGEWAEEDTYFPVEAELGVLAAEGFEAGMAWRCGVSTVLVGRRP